MYTGKREIVDLLVEQFWKQGYLTVRRKYGTYLPEPGKVGDFDIDVVAKQRKNYAIGITLTDEDLNDPKIIEKINFLATRHTKYSNKKVMLFVGVPHEYFKNARALFENIEPDVKKNIKLVQIVDRSVSTKRSRHSEKILFS